MLFFPSFLCRYSCTLCCDLCLAVRKVGAKLSMHNMQITGPRTAYWCQTRHQYAICGPDTPMTALLGWHEERCNSSKICFRMCFCFRCNVHQETPMLDVGLHLWTLGTGRELAAVGILRLSSMCSGARALDDRLDRVWDLFVVWCRQNKYFPHVSRFSPKPRYY